MVNKFKVSFIWAKSFPEIFDYDENKDSNYIYRDYSSLCTVLEGIIDGKKSDYTYPWHQLEHNNFWNSYLACKDEKRVTPSNLWDLAVPLFCRHNTKIFFNSGKYGAMRISLEPYMYHHGVAFILNINVNLENNPIYIKDIAEITFELYNTNKYEIYNQELHQGNLDLKELYNTLMHIYAKDIINAAPKQDSSVKPFTMITILEGQQEELDKESLLQNVRDIFKTVDQTYREVIPISKNKNSENIYNRNLMFCSPKGRFIWYPGMFLQSPGKRKSLGCYNKNIMRLSMHIESLMEPLKDFVRAGFVPDMMYYYVSECQHQIVKMYELMNTNLKTTYYSASAVVHLNHNDYIGLINLVRDKLGVRRKVKPAQISNIFTRDADMENNVFL